jgi:hypothetical protein
MKVDLRQLVAPKEAAEIRKVSVQAIHHLMQRGRFTIVEVSGKKFLLRQEVDNFKPDIGGRPKVQTGKKRTRKKRPTSKRPTQN